MKLLQSLYFTKKQDDNLFKIKQRRFGLANKNKIIYLVEENNGDYGFFAMYRRWIEYLYFAQICGYTPVIRAGSDFIYQETLENRNGNDAFEYYFEQPSEISLEEVCRSYRVVFSEVRHRQMVEYVFLGKYDCYYYNKHYLNIMSKIVGKYIRFNSETWSYINSGIKLLNIKEAKVLGVHIRGTDFRKKYNGHPVYIDEQEMYGQIDRLLIDKKYKKIFLATDDKRILENFNKKYRQIICCYQDVLRSDKDRSVAFLNNSRRNNQYLLGLEVIRDMYTLSMCDGLVCGISQVAVCAQMHKLARKEKFLDLHVIDKGVYDNRRKFRR